jgi:hypothetical protein
VLDTARRHLKGTGCFSKEEVITETNMAGVENAIRWDYIREFLSTELGPLVPVVSRFFKTRPGYSHALNPEKFVAQGYGKKTAGFALVRDETVELATSYLINRVVVADKTVVAADQLKGEFKAVGVLIDGTSPAQALTAGAGESIEGIF